MVWPKPVPDEVSDRIFQDMEAAEQGGEFDGLFQRPRQDLQNASESPTKERLLESIRPDMKLCKSTFMKIYGYDLSYEGFADEALEKLERAGCSRAREYYTGFVSEYENMHEKEMVKVAEWYRNQINRMEVGAWAKSLKNVSSSDLLMYLENLIKEGLQL